jgi:hypothetical protein
LTWNGALLDAIATSGDSARAAMFHGFVGSENLVHGGNTTTRRFLFKPLSIIDNPVDIQRTCWIKLTELCAAALLIPKPTST